MKTLVSDKISRKEAKELEKLRRLQRLGLSGSFPLIVVSIIALYVAITAYNDSFYTDKNSDHDQTQTSNYGWDNEFKEKSYIYSTWIGRNTGRGSMNLFNDTSNLLFSSANTFYAGSDRNNLGLFGRIFLATHFGLLRVSFLLVAWWRLWIAVIILSIIWGARSVRIYRGNDMLGATGNGRLFYSGIKGELKEVSPEGAPEAQVPGLACAKSESITVARVSDHGKLLEKYKAANQTNLGLVGIILKHKNWPAHVAEPGFEPVLKKYLGENHNHTFVNYSLAALETALSLHASYKDGIFNDQDLGLDLSQSNLESSVATPSDVDLKTYTGFLKAAFHRVLTPSLRQDLALLSAAQVATIVLANEAGKVMAFAFEAGKWARKSSFPQLCARAILHSLVQFADEYDFNQRTNIRRALIYGSRKSVLAPVKFATDLSDQARAARQWVELLMASPHELTAVSDEVEMFGIICQAHQVWKTLVLEGVLSGSAELTEDIFASLRLFFMPLKKAVKIAKKCLDPELLERLKVLHKRVKQLQQVRSMDEMLMGENQYKTEIPAYEKILAPFSKEQVIQISNEHGVLQREIEDWSSLRLIVNAFGWLGRRVGDYAVPESSVIFLAFKNGAEQENKSSEEKVYKTQKLEGRAAMVPLRFTQLQEKWGVSWASRFISVSEVRMAETKADYEKILKGEIDPRDDLEKVEGV